MNALRVPLAAALAGALALLLAWAGAGLPGDSIVDSATFLAEQVERQLAGDWSAARSHAEHTRRLFASAGDARGEAACWTLIGGAEFALGAQEQGFAAFERALRLLESVDSLAYAAVARFAARLELGRGRYAAAEERLRRALTAVEGLRATGAAIDPEWLPVYHAFLELPVEWVASEEPTAPRERTLGVAGAAVRVSLGEVLFWQGRLDEAEAELAEALRLSESAGGLLDASAYLQLGLVLQRRGESEAATARFGQSFAVMAGGECRRPRGDEERRLCFFVIERLADVANRAGRHEQALAWNDRGLRIFRGLGDPEYEARLLVERSWILDTAGDPATARAALQEALARAADSGDESTRARVLRTLSLQALGQGKVEEAAGYLIEPGAASEPDGCAGVQSALARAASYAGLGAKELAQDAAAEAVRLATEAYCSEGRWISELFVEFLRAGDPRSQGAALEAAREMGAALGRPELSYLGFDPRLFTSLERLAGGKPRARTRRLLQGVVRSALERREPEAEATARVLLGVVNERDGRREAAQAQWAAAVEIYRRLGLKNQESQVLTQMSELAWRSGDRAGAIRQAREAVAALEAALTDIRLDDHLVFFLGEKTTPYENVIEILVETGRPEDAFDYAERARARALLRLLGGSRPVVAPAAQPVLAAEAEDLRERLRDLEREARQARDEDTAAELRRAADAARREHESALFRLKLADRAGAAPTEPLALREIQGQLLPDVTLLSFFVTPGRTLVWVVGHDRFDLVTIDLGRQELARQVERFRQEIASRSTTEAATAARGVRLVRPCSEPPERSTADLLFTRLAIPLAPYLRGSRLVLVAHDSLHLLPFAALRDPDTGRYLAEDFELSYAPSASALGFLSARTGVREGRSLVLGDPALAPVEELSDLSGARREAAAVARLLGTAPRLGPEATEALLRERARGADVVHVAAHNVRSALAPRFSYLALAPDDRHDGKLEMREIHEELDLAGVDLVVLSACETAVGERTGGDEIVGLTRALLAAGAGAVMATLWSVDDDASAELATGFYRRLLAGERASAALAGAQRELLSSEETAAPFYWAAFTLVGEPWSATEGPP